MSTASSSSAAAPPCKDGCPSRPRCSISWPLCLFCHATALPTVSNLHAFRSFGAHGIDTLGAITCEAHQTQHENPGRPDSFFFRLRRTPRALPPYFLAMQSICCIASPLATFPGLESSHSLAGDCIASPLATPLYCRQAKPTTPPTAPTRSPTR